MATDTLKAPLLAETIEPDDPTPVVQGNIGNIGSTPATTTNKTAPVLLTPTNRATSNANANAAPAQLEAGEFDFSSSTFSVLSSLLPQVWLASGSKYVPEPVRWSTVLSHSVSSRPIHLPFCFSTSFEPPQSQSTYFAASSRIITSYLYVLLPNIKTTHPNTLGVDRRSSRSPRHGLLDLSRTWQSPSRFVSWYLIISALECLWEDTRWPALLEPSRRGWRKLLGLRISRRTCPLPDVVLSILVKTLLYSLRVPPT